MNSEDADNHSNHNGGRKAHDAANDSERRLTEEEVD